jgi:hypothetical protein
MNTFHEDARTAMLGTESTELRNLVLSCLKPFGYEREYHEEDNDRYWNREEVRNKINAAILIWVEKLRKATDTWLMYQGYSRTPGDSRYVNTMRKRIDDNIYPLEQALRHIAEYCGDSVDKPGK